MVLAVIAGCEIGFWVLLGAGLVARYLLRRRRLGAVLLVSVPLVDLVLLVATTLDLRRGATANFTHGLAAAYLGSSVAFGAAMVRWADQRFAYRFAGGPPPWRPPRRGRARTRHEWREWAKAALAWAIACVLLVAAIVLVDDQARTGALRDWIIRLSAVLAIWFVAGPLWFTLFPGRAEAPAAPAGQRAGRERRG
ncbi:hypothetical protein ACFFWC_11020 [Plantactinospora siamensis]|uniref:Integral membrane protein n=1 Tax=Plantactinospora siamensis TaxID=555372 RepID=A0ABV6P2D0_9ACTN